MWRCDRAVVTMEAVNVLWFRNGLRFHDNHSLLNATEDTEVRQAVNDFDVIVKPLLSCSSTFRNDFGLMAFFSENVYKSKDIDIVFN